MAHEIKFWETPFNGYDFPLWLVPTAVGGIGTLIGFIGMMPPFSGLWTVILFALGLAVMLGNIGMYNTHIARSLSDAQRDLLSLHRGLPDELQTQVPLSHDAVCSMTYGEAMEMESELKNLRHHYEEKVRAENKVSGAAYEFRVAVESTKKQVIEDHADAMERLAKYKELEAM